MSCGFGAAVLIFMIIKHNVSVLNIETGSGVSQHETLQKKMAEYTERSAQLALRLAGISGAISKTRAERQALQKLDKALQVSSPGQGGGNFEAIQEELKRKQAALLKQREKGEQVRKTGGGGRRQYLTGLSVEGKRILILLDKSASMVDEHIVNIVRGKFLPPEEKRKADKWQWALSVFNWLTAHLPPDSRYQVMGFNEEATLALGHQGKTWLPVSDKKTLEKLVKAVEQWTPENGTNLEKAFQAIGKLSSWPDAIYLITDSLPTQGSAFFKKNIVSGKDRLDYFVDAVAKLRRHVVVNVILLPTEGDPLAPDAFWRLARSTGGRFLVPPRDWP